MIWCGYQTQSPGCQVCICLYLLIHLTDSICDFYSPLIMPQRSPIGHLMTHESSTVHRRLSKCLKTNISHKGRWGQWDMSGPNSTRWRLELGRAVVSSRTTRVVEQARACLDYRRRHWPPNHRRIKEVRVTELFIYSSEECSCVHRQNRVDTFH